MMKHFIPLLLLSAFSLSLNCSVSTSYDSQQSSISLIDIEQMLAKAWVDGDLETITSILAQDWSVIDPSGHILSKDQVIQEAFASGARQIEALTINDLKVRIFGEMAVVTGRTEATGSYEGKRSSVILRFTDVFVRREGRWQVVASQGTEVTQ